MSARSLVVAAVVLATQGCGGGGAAPDASGLDAGDGGRLEEAGPAADGGRDADGPDATLRPDAGASDAGPADGGLDAGADGGLDAGADGGFDAGAGHHAGRDAGTLPPCSACHGDVDSAAPPRDVGGGTDTARRGVGAHRSHLGGGSSWHREVLCTDCHVVPAAVSDPGHVDGRPAELTWGAVATADGASPAFDGTTCADVYCHGATLLPGGSTTRPEWTRVDGSQAACGSCHGLPPGGSHPSGSDCSSCHGEVIDDGFGFVAPELHIDGTVQVDASCGSCHGLPPDTGSHRAHARLAEPVYGALGTAAERVSPDGYAFGCGFCHPTDATRHMNGGLAEIELYDPAAPPGSFKARSPTASYEPGAETFTDAFGKSYTLGRCVDAPCHGGMTATTGAVPAPGPDFPFTGYPISYPAYTVDRTFEHVAADWGGSLGCGGCHGYPPRAAYPDAEAGAGESHSYIDASGNENLHMWNHGRDPIPCRTCHAETVSEVAAFSRDASDVATLSDIPIASYAAHVDGTVDVAFDLANPVPYSSPMDLSTASWDPATSSCSDVACHLAQTTVVFGTPYRWGNTHECNVCHRY